MSDGALVDANVLLRFLIGEPPDLATRAREILDAANRQGMRLVILPLTLAEVIYVLRSVYGWERVAVADRLLDLTLADIFDVAESSIVAQALAWYRDRSGIDFPDAYIAASALARGLGTVVSFDRDLKRLGGVAVIDHPDQVGTD